MANSIRYNIIQEVKDAIEAIKTVNGYLTNVAFVSDKLTVKHPEALDGDEMPACFILDEDETKEAFTLFHATDNDMQSIFTVSITSIIFDRSGDTILARTNLMQDVEKAIVTDASIRALLIELPTPTTVETDNGIFGNWSVFIQTFEMIYIYNHTGGGV